MWIPTDVFPSQTLPVCFCIVLCHSAGWQPLTRQTKFTKRNADARSPYHCCRGKAISITFSECVCLCVAFGMRHTKHMHSIIMRSVTCPALQYFSTLPHKPRFSKKKNCWPQNVCFDFVYRFVHKIKTLHTRQWHMFSLWTLHMDTPL